MPFRKALVAAGALLVAFSLARPVHAQFASSIEGTVSDPSQAVVPGAAVTISNEATGVTQNVRTTSAGYYRFPALAGGIYTVKVSLQGFKDWSGSTSAWSRPRREPSTSPSRSAARDPSRSRSPPRPRSSRRRKAACRASSRKTRSRTCP